MTSALQTTCCIAGGGPAGVMLGLLLARAGVETVVIEKHADFFRDFRGDTIHPSTMEVIRELGWLDEFLSLPHQRIDFLEGEVGRETVRIADFRRLKVAAPYIAMMPQWTFLDFLSRKAAQSPSFRLLMSTEATGLSFHDGRVAGVTARGPDGELQIAAVLTVACDGRQSTLTPAAGFEPVDKGAPMDVFWFRLARRAGDPPEAFARIAAGRMVVMIDRGDYFQCGFVFPKGGADALRRRGLDAFHADIAELSRLPLSRVAAELPSWDEIKLLTVSVNRLTKFWRPGFLAIGDAAHAMSPVGGVGVNLAVQDAVAAANILAGPLLGGEAPDDRLAAVQTRRMLPTVVTQRLQIMIQNRVIAPALAERGGVSMPLPFRIIRSAPWLQGVAARVIGLGVRPEHIGPLLRPP